MKKSSIYYNQSWKDYHCNKCGELYQFYVDGLCSKCRVRTYKIDRAKEIEANINFSENHKSSKKRK